MKEISFSTLQAQLIKSLRGPLSQENFARKLKVQSDQIVRWENGHAKISWDDFVGLCRRFETGLEEALRSVLLYNESDWNSPEILRHICRHLSYSEIQRRTGHSKAKISRLFNGKGKTSLIDILKMIEALSLPLDSFVALLLKNRPVPEVLLKSQKYNRSLLNLIYDRPWIGALLRILETEKYLNDPKPTHFFLAEVLPIDEQEIQRTLSDLMSAGLLASTSQGKLVPINSNLLGQADRIGELKVRQYWQEKVLALLSRKIAQPKASKEPTVWAYSVLSVSESAKQEIEKRMLNFYKDIDEIVQNDKKTPEKVLYFGLQLLPVERLLK